MTTAIKILPARLDFTLVKGDRAAPVSFKVVDNNGDDITGYTAEMCIVTKIGGTPETDTPTLNKAGAATTIGLVTSLPARQYKHYIQVSLAGVWKFTIYTGEYWITLPGEVSGGMSAITQLTKKLPVLPVVGGGFVLVDVSGNPILDANGNLITTN